MAKIKTAGVVAAGHPATAEAAAEILRAGGNAFDAVIAAYFSATIAEPVLCSLAGGGFLLAKPEDSKPLLYDFFTQTPLRSDQSDIDFYPITADFGTAQQEFHIGMGSMATPGAVDGLFTIHNNHASMPMTELVAPAIEQAKTGVPYNDFQSYIFSVIAPIYQQRDDARELYGEGLGYQKLMADFFEVLAHEGRDLFYRGEAAQSVAQLCQQHGGYLTRQDFEQYQTIIRDPLKLNFRDTKIFTNPPPSAGGILIAFALDLLNQVPAASDHGSFEATSKLAKAMALTHEARLQCHDNQSQLLNPTLLKQYRHHFTEAVRSYRGTTHISVIDEDGNIASLTSSNGEGCGYLLPDTGIMLNNMLGEEDLHPEGFNTWPTDKRMSSMMSPSLMLTDDGRQIALGSGGSNRIRSAISQVVINLIDYEMSLEEAVSTSRIHLEKGHLSIEGGFSEEVIKQLSEHYPSPTVWNELNLFFGGVHAVLHDGNQLEGFGDPRRGGHSIKVL